MVMKNKNGITLIALIITIIVMLILVGVTINTAFNGGIFDKAKNAVKLTEIEADREVLFSLVMASIKNDASINFNELKEKAEGEGFTVNGNELPCIFISSNGNPFMVDEFGNINQIQKGIILSDSAISIEPENTHQLTAILTGGLEGTINYTSSDENVATVSSSGLITAVAIKDGEESSTAIITASCNGKTATCTVTVEEEKSIITDPELFTYNGGTITGLSEDGKTEVANLVGKDIVLIIPEEYNGTTITAIGNNAFVNFSTNTSEFSGIKSIALNTTNVETIGSYAFALSNIKSMNAPELITTNEGSFFSCTSMLSANMPKVITIGDGSFIGCSSLVTVNCPLATTLVREAFSGCSSLTSISLPNVTSIGKWGFNECTSLTNIEMPKVQEFADNVFKKCTFTAIEIPETATYVGSNLFHTNTNATTLQIYVPGITSEEKDTATASWSSNWYADASESNIHWGETMPNS